MNTRIRLSAFLVAGFLGGLILLTCAPLALHLHNQKNLVLVSVLSISATYLYFKHLWKFLNKYYLAPLQQMQESIKVPKAEHHSNPIVLARDISDRLAELQERERMIADHAAEIVCSLDLQLRILAVNPAVYRQWGYPPSGLRGKELVRYIFVDDRTTFQNSMAECKKRGTAITETRLVASEGELIDLEWQVEWSESSSTYFCVARDITHRKVLERAKQEFISMISHDLRTPLSSVKLSLEWMRMNLLNSATQDSRQQKLLENAASSVDTVLSLVEQLLQFDRAEAGLLTLNLQSVSAAELIDDAWTCVQSLATLKDIEVEICSSNSLVVADRQRIVQVLINLINNAVKFSERGTRVRVYVSVAPDHLVFHVQDQGRGIPKAAHKMVFERFRQVKQRDASTGSGLGLPICKLLLQAHGSEVQIQSEEGVGSTFSFRLARHLED